MSKEYSAVLDRVLNGESLTEAQAHARALGFVLLVFWKAGIAFECAYSTIVLVGPGPRAVRVVGAGNPGPKGPGAHHVMCPWALWP